jgi:Glycosyltransferase
MTRRKRLLFYSDAAEYGGHEAMTVEAAHHLAANQQDLDIAFAFHEENARLAKKLLEIQCCCRKVELKPLSHRSGSLQAIRTLLSPSKVNAIVEFMEQAEPDLVIVSQGRIESGSMGLLAAKRAGLRTISYIPMAHHTAVSGKPIATGLREKINGYFYRLPDKIVTISESARRMLLARGVICDVAVVPNGVATRTIRKSERERFRATHGIGTDEYVIAVLGRIEFRQKAQDLAVQTIASFRRELFDCRFLFVGSGPDEQQLRKMIANLDLARIAHVLPWSDDPAEVYAGIDMLLIPSRFEGVPLVMLEAMSCGLPVVASNVDGMAELLPRAWLFARGNSRAMTDTILQVKNSDNAALAQSNKEFIRSEFSIARFGAKFSEAVLA